MTDFSGINESGTWRISPGASVCENAHHGDGNPDREAVRKGASPLFVELGAMRT
jgi:hypothetical protein